MAWLIVFLALVLDAIVAFGLHRELPRWQSGYLGFAPVVPLRLVIGVLLMLLILLLGVGIAFVLPTPGQGVAPSAEMIAYWLFIALMVGVIVFLTLVDMALVRRGYHRRQEEIFAAVLAGRAPGAEERGERTPPAGS